MNAHSTIVGRSKVLVCSQDQQTIDLLEKVFSSLSAFDMKVMTAEETFRDKRVDPDQFDVVIFDVGDGSLLGQAEFLQVRARFQNKPVVFVSDKLSEERMRLLFKLDGADWLQKPLQSRSLIDSVNSITQRFSSLANKVHAVLPCGGGSGGTTVAIMLAYYLSRKRKRSQPTASIFDLDFSSAATGTYLNVLNEFQLETVVDSQDRVDLEFINVIRKQHEQGFSLFSFESPKLLYASAASELVLRMIDLISFQHDHTVLDLPSYETPWRNRVLEAVDTVTIVSGTSLPSLQKARELVKRAADLRGSEDGIKVLVNGSKKKLFGMGLGKRELAKVFGSSSISQLPEERETMLEALNRGVLPVEVNERSKFCKVVQKIAEEILQEGK